MQQVIQELRDQLEALAPTHPLYQPLADELADCLRILADAKK